jgi:hypothetical protein
MSRDPYTPDCSIKGCTRVAFTGELCRKHYALVPKAIKRQVMIDVMDATHRIGRRHHAKQLRYVRSVLSATGGTEAS